MVGVADVENVGEKFREGQFFLRGVRKTNGRRNAWRDGEVKTVAS